MILILKWLKRRPNPELIKIDGKLDKLTSSINQLATNAEDQKTGLLQLDQTTQMTVDSINRIEDRLTTSSQTIPGQVREAILESLRTIKATVMR
ncbi:MAG: hypothetical protein ABSD41_10465 [Candidatus Bathyarchaeia archaeon]